MTDRLVDLEELRRLAEQATPGPWRSFTEFPANGGIGVSGGVYRGTATDMGPAVCQTPDPLSRDAAYIAAANPATILSLLDRFAALQDELDRKHLYAVGLQVSAEAWMNRAETSEQRVMALEEGLRAVGELQPNALAYVRSNGFVFDVVGPLPDDADELTRWKVLAFSLYSDLCEAESKARSLLQSEANLQSSAASQGDEDG